MNIGRRELIAAVGSAVAWPLAAKAQQPGRIRRIGILMNLSADDPESAARITAFVQGLQQLGWTGGRNIRIDYRWGAGDAERIRKYAAELVALAPDVILGVGATVDTLQRTTRSIPIVFVQVADPVGRGIVGNLAHPGGNATGFTSYEFSMSGKLLELLKQIAPSMTKAAVLRDPTIPSGTGQFGAIQSVASSLGLEVMPLDVRDAREIEHAISDFARQPNRGLVVISGPSAAVHRALIITLSVRHRLPAVYPWRYFVADGGLISYGPDAIDEYRRAAEYVDRILKGERPADLPVQAPTKYELVINLKTAKAIGLDVPATVLARTDEIIE
jgi:putative ABC transport system substrate-binding protein